MERKILRIHYLDHVQIDGDSEVSLEKIKRMQPLQCTCIGEVLVETPLYITLLSAYDTPQEGFSSGDLRHFALVILRNTILDMKELIVK